MMIFFDPMFGSTEFNYNLPASHAAIWRTFPLHLQRQTGSMRKSLSTEMASLAMQLLQRCSPRNRAPAAKIV